jgi:parallel beta helix pectate lyase-like protein
VPDILHKSLLAPRRPISAADPRATILLQRGIKGQGAGAITAANPGAGPVVNDATFTGNTTTGSGGAIYDDSDTEGAIVTNSTFYGNTAAGAGGAILDDAQGGGILSGDVIKDNTAGDQGGGIADVDDSAIENCKISGNHASAGGGLWILSQDAAMVTGTSIEGNTAEDGGGIYDPGLEYQNNAQLTDDKITGNHASADGGGIYIGNAGSSQGTLNLAQTRILHNDAGSLGGGIYSAGAVAAAHSTISRNTARGGGGIYQATEGDGNGVVLTSSTVAHNTPDNCEPPGTIQGCDS